MKKYAIVFLSLFLVISLPFAAHANIVTATGRYLINAVKHAPGGAKVEATNTATAAKHVIKHGVSSADLGKSIGAGIVGFGVGTGAGLAFKAITGLALDAVDWVMDPANNRIKYIDDINNPSTGSQPNPKQYYRHPVKGDSPPVTAYAACRIFGDHHKTLLWKSYTWKYSSDTCHYVIDLKDGRKGVVTSTRIFPANEPWDGGPDDTLNYKYVSLNDLAAKTIEQADAGNAAAQIDIEIHVTHIAQNGDLDIELDNATDITQPENPEEPNPDEPQQCPSGTVKLDNVCVKIPDSDSDEPLFCDSSEFTKKVCDWVDWTQEEHDEPDAGKVDITDNSKDLNIDQNRIDFINQCPAPTPINTSVGGFPISTELNYQPLCDFFTMLNPFVIGMGGISSALIIAGGARRG